MVFVLLPCYPSKVATRAVKASILSSASCKALTRIGTNLLYCNPYCFPSPDTFTVRLFLSAILYQFVKLAFNLMLNSSS